MEQNFGAKELYQVVLKATYPIEVGNRKIETGEAICVFDKIQIAGLNNTISKSSANGGFDNRARVTWEDIKEMNDINEEVKQGQKLLIVKHVA